MSPWPVRISERKPGFGECRSGFRRGARVPQGSAKESERFRDKCLQGLAVHHFPGGDRGIAEIDGFLHQVRGVEIEPGEQH